MGWFLCVSPQLLRILILLPLLSVPLQAVGKPDRYVAFSVSVEVVGGSQHAQCLAAYSFEAKESLAVPRQIVLQGFLCSSGSLSHSRRGVTCLGSLRSSRPIGRLSPIGSKMPALLMRGTGWGGSSSLCCRSFALCQCPCVQLCQRCWLCPELLETPAEGQEDPVPAGAGVAQVSEASASGGLRGQGELRSGKQEGSAFCCGSFGGAKCRVRNCSKQDPEGSSGTPGEQEGPAWGWQSWGVMDGPCEHLRSPR